LSPKNGKNWANPLELVMPHITNKIGVSFKDKVKPAQQKWRVSSKCGDKKMLVPVLYTSMENESEQPCTKLQLSTSCQDD